MRPLLFATLCSTLLGACDQHTSSLADWRPIAAPATASEARSPVRRPESSSSTSRQCTEGLEFTELKASPAGKPIALELTSSPAEAPAYPLLGSSALYGVSMFPPAGLEIDLGTSGFVVERAAPSGAWKLVAERVREGDSKSKTLPLFRAALFDDKGVEMGRWQGHRPVPAGPHDECGNIENAVLWSYLKLPTTRTEPAYSSLRDAIKGVVEPRVLEPNERLTAPPDILLTANAGCHAVVSDNPQKLKGTTYQVESGDHRLTVRLTSGYSSRVPVAFVCDAEGVLAASPLGARRFRWDGTPERDWGSYEVKGVLSGAPLFPTIVGNGEGATVVDFRKVGEETGWRLTLPAKKQP